MKFAISRTGGWNASRKLLQCGISNDPRQLAGTIKLTPWKSGSKVHFTLPVHHCDKEVQVKLEASFGSPLQGG
jgi:hypothetical protein